MSNIAPLRAASLRRIPGLIVPCLVLGSLAAGCQERPICPVEPRLVASVYERYRSTQVDKVDVLLAIDNSMSMADKQALLALAVPDLMSGLVNPPCLDKAGVAVTPGPKSPLDKCPKGSARPFEPLLDIHIGVISSSLGSHGADSCPAGPGNPSENDRGHLLFRGSASGENTLPTYQNKGFLAWDPSQKLAPAGEADLKKDSSADADATALLPVLTDMIVGAGQSGCGYESQLESWYRFLADPNPYKSLSVGDDGRIQAAGVDEQLLAQRRAFLRPDSLLAIVLLTDENDCSVRESGQFYLALQAQSKDGSAFHLPAPRSECAADPNDACCFSCGQSGPKDDNGDPLCPVDPACKDGNGDTAVVEPDSIGLRCWDQKRRFGIDFLNPIDRYSNALTSKTVTDRSGTPRPNPIFSDLDPNDNNHDVRDPSMVILTGIAGVPWQDIARDPKDLTKGFKSPEELTEKDASGKSAWDVVLGDPEKGIKPLDPLMIESVLPRAGHNPVTGDKLVTSDDPLENAINGHESSNPYLLQYACIFPLPQPITCTPETCKEDGDSPVYDAPYDKAPEVQKRAGARPATRILSLLKALGPQGQPASVCPAQTNDPDALDFGYRPAMAAALARLEEGLSRSCLPRTLSVEPDGQVQCAVIEARHKSASGACCDPGEARVEPSDERKSFIATLESDSYVKQEGYDCFCEIPQLKGSDPGEPLWACQNDTAKAPLLADGSAVDGYCYIDETAGVGNSELVAKCPDTERRSLRFVGKGAPGSDAAVYITCGSEEEPSSEECHR